MRGLEQRYCEHRNHEVSRRIVDIASSFDKPVIVFENLKSIREQINQQKRSKELSAALNSWAFAELQGMVEYKAAKEGIKVKKVGAYISQNCNKCGERGTRPYNGNQNLFYCGGCDYEVNADVNAAVNIGRSAAPA